MTFTNHPKHGGKFKDEFKKNLRTAGRIQIATGYFGAPLVEEFIPKLAKISKNGGQCRILIGMVFHSGTTSKQRDALVKLDKVLRKHNKDNGVFISIIEYHGKIYNIGDDYYLGSSNFSDFGFSRRLECNTKLAGVQSSEVAAYLDYLFALETSVPLEKVGLKTKKHSLIKKPSSLLEDYKVPKKDYKARNFPLTGSPLGQIDVKLHVDNQPESSLNLYFEPGRKNRRSKGLYVPRPWFEVEITAYKKDRSSPYYPKPIFKSNRRSTKARIFNAYIKEGVDFYFIKMTVASDYGKALASSKESGGRKTFGRYIKGKLQVAGILKEGERITSEHLELYGRDTVSFIKYDDDNYLIEF
jgi:hypothetical protein